MFLQQTTLSTSGVGSNMNDAELVAQSRVACEPRMLATRHSD